MSEGPFRQDGRVRFVTESHADEAAQRALRGGPAIGLPAYLVVLAAGPAVFGYVQRSPWMCVISVLLLLLAWVYQRQYAALRKGRENRTAPRRMWITDEGFFVDGILGPAKWEWDAVVDVRRAAPYLVVEFSSREALVFPAAGAEAERMMLFLRERSTRRVVAEPGRLLLLLSVLYLMCVAASVMLLT